MQGLSDPTMRKDCGEALGRVLFTRVRIADWGIVLLGSVNHLVPRCHHNSKCHCDFNHFVNRDLLLAIVLHDLCVCAYICNHASLNLYLDSLRPFCFLFFTGL